MLDPLFLLISRLSLSRDYDSLEINYLAEQIRFYERQVSKEREKSGLRTKVKSFHNGYSN